MIASTINRLRFSTDDQLWKLQIILKEAENHGFVMFTRFMVPYSVSFIGIYLCEEKQKKIIKCIMLNVYLS